MIHEDTHSLLDFLPRRYSINNIENYKEDAENDLTYIVKAQKKGNKKRLCRLYKDFRRVVSGYVDAGYEELPAEIAAADIMLSPISTFAQDISNKTGTLRWMQGRDAQADIQLQKHLKTLAKLRTHIGYYYSDLREHAPDKVSALDIALTIFPPTQFRYVTELVQRWLGPNFDKKLL
jgi:hypothetical protein